jgi:peptide/nickel transport system substrate-binding protein
MRGGIRWIVIVLAIAVGTLSTLPAWSADSTPSSSPSPSAANSTYTVGTLQDLNSINPIKALNASEYEFLGLNYDLGIDFGVKDLAPAPHLVTKWSHSPDGLTWTYTIRAGAKWQDGVPLTANDVAFTYEFMVKNNISQFSNYFPFTTSVAAPNETTVIWKTTKPTLAPTFPPWVYILPEHIWGKLSVQEAKTYQQVPVVGSGPFQLVDWTKGQFWKFKANDSYWNGAPHIQNLVFRLFDNAEAMVAALKKGEIDFADNIPADLFNSLKGQPNIAQNVAAPTTFDQMSFNMLPNGQKPKNGAGPASTANPALQDKNVRLAIAHAIDKQTLIDKALGGHGEVGTSIVPSGFPQYHWQPTADQTIDFDIPQANQILDDAGYKMGPDGLRIDPKTGKPLIFRFFLLTSQPQEIKEAPFIKGWLKQIGIQLNTQVMTEGKFTDTWYANDFDMYMWGWGPDPDPDFIVSTFTTGQVDSWSDTGYQNPAYDALYEQQRVAIDTSTRKDLLNQMQQIIYEEVPEVVLYYQEDLQAYRTDRWTGFVTQPQPQGAKLFAYSTYSYLSLHVKSAADAAAPASSGVSGAVWLIALVVIVALAAIVILVRRRGEEERA